MGESRTDSSGTGPSEGRGEHEDDKEEFQAGTGYQPSTNQARDEPLPASHHDDGRQEPARRRGEPERDDPAGGGQADGDRAGGGQADGRDAGRDQASRDERGQDG
jgi:hypothetical protein